jgi:Spy/CpxP family protein refolding chaperone
MRARLRLVGRAAAFAAVALALGSSAAYAQYESYVELLRQDLKTQKVAIFTEALNLTDEQAAAFWPIHREYEVELAKINDARLALIREYAENYDTRMTLQRVKEITDRTFKLEKARYELREKYTKKFQDEVDPMVAGKFIWIERMLNNLGDLQISTELPFLK